MTDRDVLAAVLNKVLPRRGDLVSRTDWDNAAHAIIAALAQQGVTLTREPGLREAAQAYFDWYDNAVYISGEGLSEHLVALRAALASEDRP